MRHYRQLSGIGGLLLLAALVCRAEEPPPRVGWIESFAGSPDDYGLFRGESSLSVEYLLPVCEGDRIEVKEADGRLRLVIGESQHMDIDEAQSPFIVHGQGEPPTLWDNLMGWAGDWFTRMHTHKAAVSAIAAVSRGDGTEALVSGLLLPEAVYLGAGRRPLHLAWTGGTAPYRVSLKRGGSGKDVLALEGVTEHAALLPEMAWEPGDYLLSIQDASGDALLTDIRVLARDQVPAPDLPAGDSGPPDPLRRILSATWLASRKEGYVWRLEAYQQIADLQGYPSADVLRWALVAETEPPRPH